MNVCPPIQSRICGYASTVKSDDCVSWPKSATAFGKNSGYASHGPFSPSMEPVVDHVCDGCWSPGPAIIELS